MKNKPEIPACRTVYTWLRHKPTGENERRVGGREALAALTGQDAAALAVFVHAVKLYAYSDSSGNRHALAAMWHAAQAMQETTRPLAQEAIAHVLDWSDREWLWEKMAAAAAAARPALAVVPRITAQDLDNVRLAFQSALADCERLRAKVRDLGGNPDQMAIPLRGGDEEGKRGMRS